MSDHPNGRYGNGRYLFIRPIGAGGMGQVSLYQDTQLDRLVALKVLRTDVVGDPDHGRRLAQEARVMGKLHHPTIVTIFDVFSEENELCLVLEYVEGTDLRRYLGSGAFTTEFGVRLLHSLAQALVYLHTEHDVVHRDLKPANILIGKDGRIKVADFGIARRTTDDRLTRTGQVIGTESYIAPEVLAGGPATFASDIWSLGAVLKEAFGRLGPSNSPSDDGRIASTIQTMLDPAPQRRPTAAALLALDFSSGPSHTFAASKAEHRSTLLRKTLNLETSRDRTALYSPGVQIHFWSRDVNRKHPWKRLQILENGAPRIAVKSSIERYHYLVFGERGQERIWMVSPEFVPTIRKLPFEPLKQGIRSISQRHILTEPDPRGESSIYEWSHSEGMEQRKLKNLLLQKLTGNIYRSGFHGISCWVVIAGRLWLCGDSPILGTLPSPAPLNGLPEIHYAVTSHTRLILKTMAGEVLFILPGTAPRHAFASGSGWYAVRVPLDAKAEQVSIHRNDVLIATSDGTISGINLALDPEGQDVRVVSRGFSGATLFNGGYITADRQMQLLNPPRTIDLPPGDLIQTVSSELVIMQE